MFVARVVVVGAIVCAMVGAIVLVVVVWVVVVGVVVVVGAIVGMGVDVVGFEVVVVGHQPPFTNMAFTKTNSKTISIFLIQMLSKSSKIYIHIQVLVFAIIRQIGNMHFINPMVDNLFFLVCLLYLNDQ